MTGALLDLNGTWKVASCPAPPADGRMPDLTALEWIAASVPRAVHYDLMEAGKLENIYASARSSRDAKWVSDTDWVYTREFDVPPAVFASPRRLLKLHCVDTFSDVFVNGALVGSTANMFVPYSFDLHDAGLKARGNSLVVHVKAHARMVAAKAPEALERIALDNAQDFARVRSLIRRYQRSFNVDMIGMGSAVLGIGIPRSVEIIGLPAASIDDYEARVESVSDKQATVRLTVSVQESRWHGGALRCVATLVPPGGGAAVCSAAQAVVDGSCRLELRVPDPQPWWPKGYGKPSLYALTLTLQSGGETVHAVERPLGIRTVELVQDLPSGRKTFFLKINGVPVYVRGGNLIPIDYLNGCGTAAQNAEMLRLAVNANMNAMRLWGGGTLEPDSFFDECDRLGIMIWKDFHMHSHTYPDYDDEWVAEVRRESIAVVKLLRNHPCFTIVCGANETQEGWDAWGWRDTVDRFYGERLIYDVLKKVAAEHCPDIPYVPNSPHGAKVAQSPVDGDTHTWGNFLNATKDPQFITETCWFSGAYSRPETLEACMGVRIDDFKGLRWHRRWKDLTNLGLVNVNQYSEYHPLSSLRDYIKGLEIETLRADYTALSLLRCRSTSCNGIIYWPLNKGGPFFNFGCVDYSGRPLMSYYALKRLFADVVVNVYRDIDDIRVVVANSGGEIPKARLVIEHMDNTGRTVERIEVPVVIPHGNSARLHELPGRYCRIVNRYTEAVHARIEAGDVVLSEDTLFFCSWHEFETIPASLECAAQKVGEREWSLEIAAGGFSKMLGVESPARVMLSDNYFTQPPGRRRVTIAALDAVGGAGLPIRIESLDSPTVKQMVLR